MADLKVTTTAIPGLLVITIPVHGDNRGWFKENWQRAKMTALGLPDFGPVQNNVSFNAEVGVTRGIHAEPWDKLVSVSRGRVFGAWVDLREGPSFGASVTVEIGPDTTVFVPRGVGNGFQTLESETAYSYLVNDHWSAAARDQYTYVNLADETVAIPWPIPLDQAEISEADRNHVRLADVVPMPPKTTVILGAGGQLGTALQQQLPNAVAYQRNQVDLAKPETLDAIDWTQVGTVINAAAYTKVDAAETEGRADAWAANVTGVAHLARIAREHRLTLVHVSSDYVFDGEREEHDEDEAMAPLGVYGQTKAAGDAIVSTVPQHYIVRTSWVIGEGNNFVKTMASLADRGISPTVVSDQFGRLTFTDDLARAIDHLVTTAAPYGIYNVSSDGPIRSWADIAADVFAARGRERGDVTPISAEEYGAGKALAPRPTHSALPLAKIKATGFTPVTEAQALADYLSGLAAQG